MSMFCDLFALTSVQSSERDTSFAICPPEGGSIDPRGSREQQAALHTNILHSYREVLDAVIISK